MNERTSRPFTTTRQLAELVARLVPARPHDIHPATRTFQALRIAVNDELGELVRALAGAERVLESRRPSRRGQFPLSRRPHREAVPCHAQRARPDPLTPVAGRADRAASEFPSHRPSANRSERGRNARKSSGSVGQAQDRHTHCGASPCSRCRARREDPPGRSTEAGSGDMLRYLNVLAVIALIGSAVYAYSIKYETMLFSEQILKTRQEIARQRDKVEMLRAEWAYLTRTGTDPGTRRSASRPATAQTRPESSRSPICPIACPRSTQSGANFESLGLGEPTNTPHDAMSAVGGAATPSSGH